MKDKKQPTTQNTDLIPKIPSPVATEIKSLDFNKAEYQEIILSNSNHPEAFFDW